jgi:hypothetical protein
VDRIQDIAVMPVDGTIILMKTWPMGILPATQGSVHGATGTGFAYTSPGMVRSLLWLLNSQRLGTLSTLYLHLDLTFKNLYNGWATLVLGASVLVKTGSDAVGENNSDLDLIADCRMSNSFVPLLMGNVKTENGEDVARCLEAFVDMVHKFGGAGAQLSIDGVMVDASDALVNAVEAVLRKGPNAQLKILNCYFHVTAAVKKNKALLGGRDKQEQKELYSMVKADVRRMHLALAVEQFEAFKIVIIAKWISAGKYFATFLFTKRTSPTNAIPYS